MIDGIKYHPKKKKSNAKFNLWILSFALIAMVVYYFPEDVQAPGTSPVNLIVIKEAEDEETKIGIIPVNIETSESESRGKKLEVLENLDEVIQIYQK